MPHVTNEIQAWVERVANKEIDGKRADICVIELGGTVGDIEQMHFIEAMRQFQFRVGRDNFCNIHVSLIPVLGVVGEQKTKPTQQTVRELRALGISPDIIACRSETPLTESTRNKVSLFCQVAPENVLSVENVASIYHVPILLAEQGLHNIIFDRLKLKGRIPSPDGDKLLNWKCFADKYEKIMFKTPDSEAVHIAIVGKYTELHDAYTSVDKALQHAAVHVERKLKIDWVESSDLEEEGTEAYTKAWNVVKSAHGILVPGGYGNRGVEGKIKAAHYARTNQVPYLGLCLGFQIAVIEYARNVLQLQDATSEEFVACTTSNAPVAEQAMNPNQVIIFMPEISKTHMGGTMRLGKRKTVFQSKDCTVYKLYGCKDVIEERHRHRYEVNPAYVKQLEAAGCAFVGQDELGQRMQVLELKDHVYFVGTQYHPEFLSRPNKPSPPFVGLMQAASERTSQATL